MLIFLIGWNAITSLFVSGQAATDQITSVGNAATLTAGVKSGSAKWYKNGHCHHIVNEFFIIFHFKPG